MHCHTRMDVTVPTDHDMNNYPHVFLMADSPWDSVILDNKFEEEFYDAVMELPQVQECCNSADPCVDGHGFFCLHEDYKALFCAQDNSIAQNQTSNILSSANKVFCDASSAGVTIHDNT